MIKVLEAGWLAIVAFDDLSAAISTHFGNSLTKQDILRHHALDPGSACPTIARCRKALMGDTDRNPKLRAVREFMLHIIQFDEKQCENMINQFKNRNKSELNMRRFERGLMGYKNSPSLPVYFNNWRLARENWEDNFGDHSLSSRLNL